MLTRDQLDDLIVDYMYDELTVDDREAVEAALLQHPELAEEVSAHRETRALMAEMPMLDPPQPMLDTVMRAARHAAAPDEPKVGLWGKILGMFAQPAFATFAVVAGVAVTAVFALGGDKDSGVTEKAPVVAQVDRLEGASKAGAALEPRVQGPAVASVDKAEEAEQVEADAKVVAKVEQPTPSVAGSTTPLPARAKTAAPTAKAKQVASAKTGRSKARKKVKPAPKADKPIEIASADDGRTNDRPAAARMPTSEAIRVAEASEPTTASLSAKPKAAPSATTHPGMGDGTKTPANAAPRLVKRFQTLVKAGELAKAEKVLAQLAKVPSVPKAKVKALRDALEGAKAKAAPPKK